MKHLLITAIAAVVLVGCGPSLDIHEAANTGNIEAVKQHLADGVDVNVTADGGFTALHGAVISGHKELIELLIAKGANVNAMTEDRWTPLGLAIQLKRTEIANLLRQHGGKTAEELKAEGK
jgi:ankyrin repeat protein